MDRPPFFAMRFIRLMGKTGAAEQMGVNAFALCCLIACYGDLKRHRVPVTFYNQPLMGMLGLSKWESLDRARKKAVEAGWLGFEPGGADRSPGRYWVTIPPGLEEIPDSADEGGTPEERAFQHGYEAGFRDGQSARELSPSSYPKNGGGACSLSPLNGAREGERQGERQGARRGEREGAREGAREGEPSSHTIPNQRESAPSAHSSAPSIPDSINTPEFLSAWTDWNTHRREIRKPLKPTQAAKQLKQFAEWGVSRSISAIEHTIAKGWQGIREPESVQPVNRVNGHGQHRPRAPTDEDIAEINRIGLDAFVAKHG